MIIKEYRIVLPMTTEEYQIGQLFSVAEASRQETGGGEGVEIVTNEPFEDVPLFNGAFTRGQYTRKIYHLQSKVPAFLRKVLPKGMFAIQEDAWNAYPYCKTVLTNPDYMKDNFFVRIETIHLNNDRGNNENAHCLPHDLLSKRDVVNIDIANDHEFLHPEDLDEATKPSRCAAANGRGPLTANWRETCKPVMCAYKLVTVHFKWFGLQNLVENFGHKQYPRLFSKFHREVFCWMDRWITLTMDDIRRIEEQTRRELEEARRTGQVRGMRG